MRLPRPALYLALLGLAIGGFALCYAHALPSIFVRQEGGSTDDGYDFFDTSGDKDLPPCNEKQRVMREKSIDCYRTGFAPGKDGICPQNCCCDVLVRPQNRTRVFGAVGSCFTRGTVNKKGEAIVIVVLPYSPLEVGSIEKCSKITKEICGPVIGKGCTVRATTIPNEGDSEESENNDRSSKKEDESDKSTRNKILLSVCVSLLVLLVLAAMFWFIVLPWWRGTTRQSDMGSSDESVVDAGNFEQLHADNRLSMEGKNAATGLGKADLDGLHEHNIRGNNEKVMPGSL